MKPPSDHAGADPAAWLLTGKVMHERLRPKHHRFTYPVFYVRCDLDRLASLDSGWFGIDRWRPLSLYRRDHGPRDGSDLAAWMREQLSAAGMEEANGRIWLQAFPRVFGYAFNPVSFWFCHDRDGQLRALFAEVRNTFGERHNYLLSASGNAPITADTRLTCRKVLHVSPFCRVEGGYTFRVRQACNSASVSIDYHDADGLLIRTALGGRLTPLTRASALAALLRQPLLTVGVVARIHWQALRLALKKAPFHGKHCAPRRTADAPTDHAAAGQSSAATRPISSD
ncbi:DUF1365 domain-containing protein [Paraburkholderia sp. FT54]|jgi:hypothetical protein|uniref:DUF1365 domain-containing protein n=1 Tax=Paraburkholderia sp. FT54 TaxID=3074437 RepID=UPI002877B171|nr:DUF1365 domain-containing protein [Paraburkholderia sp. FT54]WNC88953.1 DUF1365 domain-containing protein [Paraburkholderia sp. FT54]